MSIHQTFKTKVNITRRPEQAGVSSFEFNDTAPGEAVVIEGYYCNIVEGTVRFTTGKEGEQFTRSLVMNGMLTNLLQEGYIVAGKYRIVGEPKTVSNSYTRCNLVGL